MISTKPHWMQPLEKLLEEFQQRFDGEIVWPAEDSSGDRDTMMHPCPILRSTFQGVPIEIELLTEHKLHIHVLGSMPSYFEIWPAGISDRLLWHLGLGKRAVSGSTEFDRRFTTDLLFQDHATILKDQDVQQLITSLEPFVYLRVHHKGILIAREIHHHGSLAADEINEVLTKLVALLRLAGRIES